MSEPPDAESGTTAAVVPFRPPSRLLSAVDVSLGAGAVLVSAAAKVAGAAAPLLGPFLALAMRPPLLDRALSPASVLARVTARGTVLRVEAGAEVEATSQLLVPAVVDAVVARLDVTALVLDRVDLVRVVEAVLDRIDLTALVLERVDLDRVVSAVDVDAVAARLDVDAVAQRLDVDAVAAQLDLVGIANYVVEAIDLPEIIRTSTGSVATEAVRGVRMQSIEADAQLQRAVDRVLLRRRARRTEAPTGE